MGLDQDQPGGVPARATAPWRFTVPVVIVSVSLLAEAGGDPVRDALRYGRLPIADGEWWRLASGHFVHLGWSHYLMNALAMLLIWALVGRHLRGREWLVVIAVVVAGIDLGFWFLDPSLYWYVGLSGLLHGILCAGLVAGFGQARLEVAVVGVLLVLKLAYEQVFGAMPGSGATTGGSVVVNAHLYGAVVGTAVALVPGVRRRRSASI